MSSNILQSENSAAFQTYSNPLIFCSPMNGTSSSFPNQQLYTLSNFHLFVID